MKPFARIYQASVDGETDRRRSDAAQVDEDATYPHLWRETHGKPCFFSGLKLFRPDSRHVVS